MDKAFFIKEIISISVIILTFLVFGLFGYVSGAILLIFPVYYMIYFLASWVLASRQRTQNYREFVDLSDMDKGLERGTVFRRNLLKERDSIKKPTRMGRINAEQNVISHTSQNRV